MTWSPGRQRPTTRRDTFPSAPAIAPQTLVAARREEAILCSHRSFLLRATQRDRDDASALWSARFRMMHGLRNRLSCIPSCTSGRPFMVPVVLRIRWPEVPGVISSTCRPTRVNRRTILFRSAIRRTPSRSGSTSSFALARKALRTSPGGGG